MGSNGFELALGPSARANLGGAGLLLARRRLATTAPLAAVASRLDLLRLDAAGINYDYHVLVGQVAMVIARFAKEQEFDHVLMASHGRPQNIVPAV